MEDKIFQVLVPEEDEIEIRGGQRVTVQKKVYPGYVLVEMVLDPDSWFVVRNTPGVTSFVGGGNIPGSRNEPIPLEEHEVKQILRQMGVETPTLPGGLPEGPERACHGRPVRRVHRHRRRGQPRAQQGQGAGEHLRPRDARRAGLPPGREALMMRPPCRLPPGTRSRSRALDTPGPSEPPVAKKIRTVVTLQLPAGKATPAPPVGTVLGPHGINIVEFTKTYNERTAAQTGRSSRPRSPSSRTAASRSSSRRRPRRTCCARRPAWRRAPRPPAARRSAR